MKYIKTKKIIIMNDFWRRNKNLRKNFGDEVKEKSVK